MNRIGPLLLLLLLVLAGCNTEAPNRGSSSTLKNNETAVVQIRVFDQTPPKLVPPSRWSFVSNISGDVEKTSEGLTISNVELGSYEATVSAEGFWPERQKIKVDAADPRFPTVVGFNLAPRLDIEEDAAYEELKRQYTLKIYRPEYLPEGFVLQENPIVKGDEAAIWYRSGTQKILIQLGVVGDLSLGIPSINILGNKAVVSADSANSIVNVYWSENVGGTERLYGVTGYFVSEKEVIRVAQSLHEQ